MCIAHCQMTLIFRSMVSFKKVFLESQEMVREFCRWLEGIPIPDRRDSEIAPTNLRCTIAQN